MKLSRCLIHVAKGLCPKCGQGNIIATRFKLKSHCENCQLKLIQSPGDGWAFLLFLDRAFFIFPIVLGLFLGMQELATPILVASGSIFVAIFLYLTPQRIGISLAIEFWIREGRNLK